MKKHPQLKGLQVLWNFNDEILNKVLWVNTPDGNGIEKATAIGEAASYLEYLDGSDYSKPEDAWEEWCLDNDLVHEINNNPYL